MSVNSWPTGKPRIYTCKKSEFSSWKIKWCANMAVQPIKLLTKALVGSEIQTTSMRIWTRVTDSISCNNNDYTKCTLEVGKPVLGGKKNPELKTRRSRASNSTYKKSTYDMFTYRLVNHYKKIFLKYPIPI